MVSTGQVYHVLGGVIQHVLCQGSFLPEAVILFHFDLELIFLCVLHIQVGLQQIIQTDVIVLVLLQFGLVIQGLADDTMGNLSVEDLVAYHVVLVNKS